MQRAQPAVAAASVPMMARVPDRNVLGALRVACDFVRSAGYLRMRIERAANVEAAARANAAAAITKGASGLAS